jgi:hypothetical protein
MMVAAALGGTVLTAVPAVLPAGMVTAAHADCDHQTGCDDEEPEEPDYPEADPQPGDANLPALETVVITGSVPLPTLPVAIPILSPGSGNGGTQGVVQVGPPRREAQLVDCVHNSFSSPQHVSQQVTYTTSWQISGNVSGGVQGILTAQLGAQFNTTTTHQQTVDGTIPPGGGIGLYVQYERATYIVTIGDPIFGYTSESVDVRSPTNTTVIGSC